MANTNPGQFGISTGQGTGTGITGTGKAGFCPLVPLLPFCLGSRDHRLLG